MATAETALPENMRAVEIVGFGGPGVLKTMLRPVPRPGPGEILVRIAAAGVNRPDLVQRQGHYPPPPGAPDIPGLEIAGEVVALGEATPRWRLGDRVTALLPGGGYAEYGVVHGSNALPVPGDMGLVAAAALPETFFTVWSNVFERGGLQPEECLLVHGGASGIGTVAIQLGKAFGARVVATAGTDEKCTACLRLGADLAVNYARDDFVAAVAEFTAGQGADLILDMVGGDYVTRNYEAAAVEGRIVQIAGLRGFKAQVDTRLLMTKRLTHTGSTLRARPVAFKAAIAAALEARVWPLLAAGSIAPVIDATFPLTEAAAAHAYLEKGSHVGKVVLTTDR